jgi:hypothetical protein
MNALTIVPVILFDKNGGDRRVAPQLATATANSSRPGSDSDL